MAVDHGRLGGEERDCSVVHVVQDSALRAPQKYHAPLTITVGNGLLRSTENADHAA
jgi:hypothetical protein